MRAGGNAVGRLQRGDGPSRVTVEVKVSLGGDANQIFRSSLLFSRMAVELSSLVAIAPLVHHQMPNVVKCPALL